MKSLSGIWWTSLVHSSLEQHKDISSSWGACLHQSHSTSSLSVRCSIRWLLSIVNILLLVAFFLSDIWKKKQILWNTTYIWSFFQWLGTKFYCSFILSFPFSVHWSYQISSFGFQILPRYIIWNWNLTFAKPAERLDSNFRTPKISSETS